MPPMSDTTAPSIPDGYGYASVTVPSRVESIRLAAAFIVQSARIMHVPAASESLFEVAIVEALNNALEHGNPERRPEAMIVCELETLNHRLTVRILETTNQRLTLRILDHGKEFVLRQPDPDWNPDDVTTIPEGGFGLPIIQGVFPMVRTIARPGEFGVEMALNF
jgi:anti-sigma regulatory factor (Ser/Thr protein kinase)